MKRTPLRRKSKTTVSKLKDELWKLCRQIILKRYGSNCTPSYSMTHTTSSRVLRCPECDERITRIALAHSIDEEWLCENSYCKLNLLGYPAKLDNAISHL